MMTNANHVPVMADEIVTLLAPALHVAHPTTYVDATLGLGGHAARMLATYPNTRLIGIDRDPSAIERASARLAAFKDRVQIVHAVYSEVGHIVAELAPAGVDAVLFDLGVSSPQLDESERGFSYANDAPLDMRMDPTTGVTAEEVVNSYSLGQLARVIATFGEERFAKRVAAAIVKEREGGRITSSARLAELVRDAIPAAARRTGGHPAKRTFQALRIEVNSELDALAAAIPAALDVLRLDGRIAVLSYHSLEDRLVKQAFAELAIDKTPIGLPTPLPEAMPELALVTRGAATPSEAEVEDNPRAASARLRVAQRIREAS